MTKKTAAPDTKRLYFGYGSNLWIDQMNRRCPQNKLVGLGVLRGWKWIINDLGSANIVRSSGDRVYGLVYEVSPSDEAALDKWEGVPWAYTKHTLEFELRWENNKGGSVVQGLVYVDEERTEEAEPREEYIHRMNMAIKDGATRGFPRWYIDKHMRRFIPDKGGKEAVGSEMEALRHAVADAKSKM